MGAGTPGEIITQTEHVKNGAIFEVWMRACYQKCDQSETEIYRAIEGGANTVIAHPLSVAFTRPKRNAALSTEIHNENLRFPTAEEFSRLCTYFAMKSAEDPKNPGWWGKPHRGAVRRDIIETTNLGVALQESYPNAVLAREYFVLRSAGRLGNDSVSTGGP